MLAEWGDNYKAGSPQPETCAGPAVHLDGILAIIDSLPRRRAFGNRVPTLAPFRHLAQVTRLSRNEMVGLRLRCKTRESAPCATGPHGAQPRLTSSHNELAGQTRVVLRTVCE